MKRAKKTNSGKLAVLITESSVFTDKEGQIISKGGGEGSFHKLGMALVALGLRVKVIAIREFPEQKKHEFIDGVEYERYSVGDSAKDSIKDSVVSKTSFRIFGYLKLAIAEARAADYVFVNQFSPHLILPFVGSGGAKGRKKCKKIAVIHDVYKNKGLRFWVGQFGITAGVIGSLIERLQLLFDRKYADEILTVSEESKKKILSAFGGSRNGKGAASPACVVVTWPVGGGESKSKPILLKDKKEFILFVGRFVDYKNPSHVLHVLKEIKKTYPKFKAVFVASRIDKRVMNEFTALRYKLGLTLKDVVIEENVSYEKLQNYYKEAKLLVHPSFVEGQGMVIPEALAWKTPVVAYDLEAYAGLRSCTRGICAVPHKDGAEGLSKASLKVLDNYTEWFKKAGFDGNASLEKFMTVIRSLL